MKKLFIASSIICLLAVTGCKNDIVLPTTINGLTIDNEFTIVVNQNYQLNPVASPANITRDYTLRYESDDPTVATASETGIITGVKNGRTRVRAMVYENGIFQQIAASTVVNITPYTLKFNSNIYKLPAGTTAKPIETVTPMGSPYTLVWASTNSNIASVNENGTITAVNDGQTTITVHIKEDPTIKVTLTVYVGIGDFNPGSGIGDIDNGNDW